MCIPDLMQHCRCYTKSSSAAMLVVTREMVTYLWVVSFESS